MRAPFKALKGAGTYMMGMFDDMRTRFLELNGSIPPRSRVDHVKAGSENIFRQTYKAPPPANLYTVQAYYPPYQQPTVQKYSEPVKEYSSYQNVEVRANEENVADIGLTDAEIREIGNSIDDGYKTQDDFGLQTKRREIVQQRSRHPLSETQRNQRSYLEDTGSYEYERPIPVPVPIAVNPARLVFPSIQNMHPVVGHILIETFKEVNEKLELLIRSLTAIRVSQERLPVMKD
ncbi:hypothetical protein Avbf_05205 [Armadillidium vulgare]|nr:hypothetical protein Avbf_05205 [Armadillidium vulgare]